MRVRERTQVMTALPPVNGPKPLPEHLNPRKRKRFDIKLDRRFWIKVALAAVGMFILVMGIITGIELIGQKPVSSIVGNTETSRSTTIGSVTNSSSSSEIEEEQEQQNEEAPASPTESTPATEPEEEEESEATTSARPTTSPTATPTATTEVEEEESTPEEDVSTTAVPQTTPTQPSPEE
jgi:hypothetical protein